MRLLITFVAKEFKHILRDPRTLLILFGMPIVQILLFGFALSNEVKNTKVVIVDNAHDQVTSQIVAKIAASRYFDLAATLDDADDVDHLFRTGDAKLAIVFPADFGRSLRRGTPASVQLLADGSDPNAATTIINYASAILADFATGMLDGAGIPFNIDIDTRMLYNPELEGAFNFVPGVMALVLMLVCVLMTSVAIVREKEYGTMEVLLVSPMRPLLVIVSKMIPYFVLSFAIIGVILTMGVNVLDVPIRGSIALLLGISVLFVLTCLGIGLLISNFTSSQQTAMLATLIGMMLPTLVFSGFMFPIESMPVPLQLFSDIVPSKWFFYAIQGVMIKGVGLDSLVRETVILASTALLFLGLSVRTFKVRLT